MNIVDEFVDGIADDLARQGVCYDVLPPADGPQRLPPLQATECNRCHRRVYFQFRSSVASTDPRFRVVYLRCPFCGHTATQLQEIVEKLPTKKPARQHFKYRA